MGLEHALSQPVHWQSALLGLDDQRLIGVSLAACSRLVLPYWEAHNHRDDKMEDVVSAMTAWVRDRSPKSQQRVLNSLQRVAVQSHGYLSPVWPVPPGTNCPGDHAGDSIVAAANAITEIGHSDFTHRAEDCLDSAAHAVSQMIGHRQPDDEATDFWTQAIERIRLGIIKQLQDWELYAT